MGKNFRPGRNGKPGEIKSTASQVNKTAEGIVNLPRERQLFTVPQVTTSELLERIEELTPYPEVKEAVKKNPAYPKQN